VTPRHAPFLAKALLATLAVGAVGAWPAYALQGAAGVRALLLATGVGLVGAVAGRGARRLVPHGTPEGQLSAAMAAVGARLLVTAALVLAVVSLDVVPVLAFGVWVAVVYLALLLVEVWDALAGLRDERTAARSAGEGVS
jgi:hypothetical protein